MAKPKPVAKAPKPKAPEKSRSEKLTQWRLYTVLLSLLPFYVLFLGSLILRKLDFPFTHGELYLVSVALTADGIGDLISDIKSTSEKKMQDGARALGVLVLATGLFIYTIEFGNQVDVRINTLFSIISFVFAIITTANCKFPQE